MLLEDVLDRHKLTVQAIVVTHAHIDHIGGAARLKARTGAPVYMNAADQELYDHLDMQASWLGMRSRPSGPAIDRARLATATHLTLGSNEIQDSAHTRPLLPAASSLYVPSADLLLAGDTLFRDSIGRTDLPGGNSRQLLSSIHSKLLDAAGGDARHLRPRPRDHHRP